MRKLSDQISHTAYGTCHKTIDGSDDRVEITVTFGDCVKSFKFGLHHHCKIYDLIVVPLEKYVDEEDEYEGETEYMLNYAQDAAELWMLHNSEDYSEAMIGESLRNPSNK